MLENLLPIDLPPGYSYKGTPYQSKGRWYQGSLVRFFQGNKQPIGGWVQRTLSGATITGTPNAALSWQTNDGTSYLAVGTTTGLFVVTSGNVVSNITPAVFNAGAGVPSWQLDTFGSYLVAIYNGSGTNPGGTLNLFYWAGNPAVPAAPVIADLLSGPYFGSGVVTTPERFLVMLRGTDPATLGGGAPRAFRASQAGATTTLLVD